MTCTSGVAEPGGDDEIARLAGDREQRCLNAWTTTSQPGRLVADASHELRSPLTSLRAQLEVGLSRPDRTDWPERAASALGTPRASSWSRTSSAGPA